LWLKELRTNANPDAKVFLIGNKADLESNRKVFNEEGESFKTSNDIDLFMECSAKSGFNAKNVFLEAAKTLYIDYLKYRDSKTSILINNIEEKRNSIISEKRSSLFKLNETEKNDGEAIKNVPTKSKGCC
jgi:GTPase SAR1 family protein